MSQSLVRRGLDLFKDDLSSVAAVVAQQQQGSSGKKKKMKSKEAMLIEEVGTNKKGFKRKLQNLQKAKHVSTKTTLKNKKLKSATDLYDAYTKRDATEDNVKALNYFALMNNDATKLDKESHKKKGKQRYRKRKDEPVKPKAKEDNDREDGVFTESDFTKFFNEYEFS